MIRFSALALTLMVAACGGDDDLTSMSLTLPLSASLNCNNNSSPISGARLYISGGLPACDLTVGADGVSGSCGDIPTGIDRYLVLRYSGARDAPLRYAVAIANLDPQDLRGTKGKVDIDFANDGQTGFFIDTDADVAQLATSLYGATQTTGIAGARCFARSVIAADVSNDDVTENCFTHEALAPVLDIDDDGCTNQRESCDGTSPTDPQSRSCN